VLNDRRDRRSKFKIAAKMIKTHQGLVYLRGKILIPLCSVLFYIILLAHTMTHDARRLFGLNF
jgi:hypothetical protein